MTTFPAVSADRARSLAIETEGLVKVFGETRAVDGIDLTVLCNNER